MFGRLTGDHEIRRSRGAAPLVAKEAGEGVPMCLYWDMPPFPAVTALRVVLGIGLSGDLRVKRTHDRRNARGPLEPSLWRLLRVFLEREGSLRH